MVLLSCSPRAPGSARPFINHPRRLPIQGEDLQGGQEVLVFTGVPQTHARSRKSKHSRHTEGSAG